MNRKIDAPNRGVCGDCGHQAAAHEGRCAWPGCPCAGMVASLTRREFEIFKLLACGDTVKAIASKLSLSAKTVEAHKYNLCLKIGAHKALELSLGALRCGAIRLEDLPELQVRIGLAQHRENPPT